MDNICKCDGDYTVLFKMLNCAYINNLSHSHFIIPSFKSLEVEKEMIDIRITSSCI